MTQKVKVVLAKPGLDGHNRGIQHVARSLMEAGFEVVYLGLYQTPEQIVTAALEEDADVIGISVLACASVLSACERVLGLLREHQATDVMVVVGGIIHPDESRQLTEMGVSGVFGPGTSTARIVDFINDRLETRRNELKSECV